MRQQKPQEAEGNVRIAQFNYLADSVPHSLYRNGNVSLTRNPDAVANPLSDAAAARVEDVIPAPSFAQRLAGARLALQDLAQHGVTTIHDITGAEQLRVFQYLAARDSLSVRVCASKVRIATLAPPKPVVIYASRRPSGDGVGSNTPSPVASN